jgi:hypothetical protein
MGRRGLNRGQGWMVAVQQESCSRSCRSNSSLRATAATNQGMECSSTVTSRYTNSNNNYSTGTRKRRSLFRSFSPEYSSIQQRIPTTCVLIVDGWMREFVCCSMKVRRCVFFILLFLMTLSSIKWYNFHIHNRVNCRSSFGIDSAQLRIAEVSPLANYTGSLCSLDMFPNLRWSSVCA